MVKLSNCKALVTGSDGLDTNAIGSCMETLRDVSDLPICVGFGISSSEDVATISSFADGVVIGSAFEKAIEENISRGNIASVLADKVSEFKKATRMQ